MAKMRVERKTVLSVGLTGGIASGKSTVADYLAEKGALCADADSIAREVIAEGTDEYNQLVDHFDRGILEPNGSIDRSALAKAVFADPAELDALNRIVHPATIARIRECLEEWRLHAPDGIGVIQVPLLIEAGMVELFDIVVVVVTTPEQQISRLAARGLTIDQGLARMRNQLSDAQRLVFADFTLINKGSLGLLKEQTGILYEELVKKVKAQR